MRKYIFIIIGGIFGAMSRYGIKGIQIHSYKGHIPLQTLLINVTGSFLLAMLLTIALEVWNFDEDIRLGIGTGFLGAYTTFSSLCKEVVLLINGGFYLSAIFYSAASIVLGLLAAYLGYTVAIKAFKKPDKKEGA